MYSCVCVGLTLNACKIECVHIPREREREGEGERVTPPPWQELQIHHLIEAVLMMHRTGKVISNSNVASLRRRTQHLPTTAALIIFAVLPARRFLNRKL